MEKPAPRPNADTQPYWDACAREQLIYQSCTQCGRAQFHPRARCVHCGAATLEWLQSAGHGTVYAVTEVHVGQISFKEDAPYCIALIELDEGFRIMTNVVGDRSSVVIGSRGRIVFEARGEFKLPQFVM
jgi:uncharacterized OB-fold protein